MTKIELLLDFSENFTFYSLTKKRIVDKVEENSIIALDVSNLCIKKKHLNAWFHDLMRDIYDFE